MLVVLEASTSIINRLVTQVIEIASCRMMLTVCRRLAMQVAV